jgi:hypothetical protein
MEKKIRYLTAISMFFVFGLIVAGGLQMPWNEEALRYAFYGSAVGFYAAITMSMFVVWKIQKRSK